MFRLAVTILALSAGVAFAQDEQPGDAAPPTGMTADEADERDLQELIQTKQKMSQQYDAINQMNPLSTTGMGTADPKNLPKQLQWLAPLLQNEAIMARAKKLAALMQNPAFQKSAVTIAKNPNLKWMYGGFAVVFVLYFLLKRRVMAATDRWWARILMRVMLLAVFFLGIFTVGYAVLGQPLLDLLWALRGVI